jgi:hypothetical protein
MKIRPVRAELFHADRRTDITKLIVAFRNFANAPKKSWVWMTWLGNKNVLCQSRVQAVLPYILCTCPTPVCLGIPFVPSFPGLPWFCGFKGALSRYPAKFGFGLQISQGFQSHKKRIFVTELTPSGRSHVRIQAETLNYIRLQYNLRPYCVWCHNASRDLNVYDVTMQAET